MIASDDKVGPPPALRLQCCGECLRQLVGSIVGSLEVDERPDPRLASGCTPRAIASSVGALRRSGRVGDVMPADPHHPQIGNLKISADPKTFGKQATRQHECHRKDTRYSLAKPGPYVGHAGPHAEGRLRASRPTTPAMSVALRFGCHRLFDLIVSVQAARSYWIALCDAQCPWSSIQQNGSDQCPILRPNIGKSCMNAMV
jgi:hypothetical protein